jgi:hypothetical protein|tara:strand:- start:80 stop:400 length:321 start_codon:yes stop_codon:yes gene_type:complete
MNEDFKTAKSYRTGIIDDNAYITINWKLLVQFGVLVISLSYAWYDLQGRIKDLEEEVLDAHAEIRLLVDKHQLEESIQLEEMETKLKFYEKEFNINPLSWRKRKKK